MTRPLESPVSPTGPAGDEASVVWWRLPILWLVVGGPLVVVVAAIVTGFIAWHGADEVLDTQAGGADSHSRSPAQEPALRARNHAATPR